MIFFSVHSLSTILGNDAKNINNAKNIFPIKPKITALNQYKLKSLGVLNVFLEILTIAMRGTDAITGTAKIPPNEAEEFEKIARTSNNPPTGNVNNLKTVI